MGSIINAEKISKSYTGRMLLKEASFSLQEGEKVGIVGINGTGKSTLLRILAGEEEADEGEIIKKKQLVISYLPQTPVFDPEMDVLSAVRQKALDHQNTAAASSPGDVEASARALLGRFGIFDLQQKMGQMSGGQRKRAALVSVLLAPCDVLILDEPTNHLDIPMVEWLEDYLRNFTGSMIMITHDRYFLDAVTNRIVEVSRGALYSYETNYFGYLQLKEQRMEYEKAAERKRQSILRKEIAWMQRGARARSTKQKAHIQRYEALRDQEAPVSARQLAMGSIATRMGNSTIELSNITKSYGDRVVIRDFSYHFQKEDRIGIIGTNGAGKTTLMNILTGQLAPDQGEVTIGSTIKIGYYAQEISNRKEDGLSYMDPNLRVIDYIKNTAEYVRTDDGLISASAMLEEFLFPPEEQYAKIEVLSGGEKRRLNLLRVLMEAPNVLILDEPTNDLDTETLAVLEDFLDRFRGIVIVVSHDRYFLDRIVGRIFAFSSDGTLKGYEGGYTDYARKAQQEGLSVSGDLTGGFSGKGSSSPKDSKETWTHQKKLKFTYQEQKDYEVIEQEIAALEEKLEELEQKMVEKASDYGALASLQKEKEEAEEQLEGKMERWEYLEDLKLKIDTQ